MNSKQQTANSKQQTANSKQQTAIITLKKLVECCLEQQIRVLEIRNQDAVRSSMYTDHQIGINEHLGWISRLKADKKQIVFAVLNNQDKPIGVVSINALDTLHKKADWAFYLDENERGGLGAALEYAILDYSFSCLGLDKLNCEVIETNNTVVKLHKKFGFAEEGLRRSNIEKHGERIGVYFLGIMKDEWQSSRVNIKERYGDIIERYDVRFAKDDELDAENPLTQIENARARNNVNWMALLRLCIEQNPDIAKPIVSEILRLDTEISSLTKKLVT